jgi:hypothetical protein
MYQMRRVFCGTSWELEGERRAFYDVVGEVNENVAMKRGVLYVPVSLLTRVRDKRPLQYEIDENIRACHYFLLALTDGWGPAERHFERDYRLALSCQRDPELPMREIAFLWQSSVPGTAVADGLPAPTHEFSTTESFKAHTRALLSGWLRSEP